jgi:hypothetical protein
MIEIIADAVTALQAEVKGYPEGVQIWMKVMAVTFLTSIFFVYKHTGARWFLLAFVINIIGLIAGKILFPDATRTIIGSFVHVFFWTPILWAVWRPTSWRSLASTRNNKLNWLYLVWLCGASLVMAISLAFDFRTLFQM